MTISATLKPEHATNPNNSNTEVLTVTLGASCSLHYCNSFDLGGTATQINASGVASSPALTWSFKDAQTDNTDGQRTEHWVADGGAAGSITITATYNGNTPASASIVKEIDGTSGYDTTANAHASAQQTAPGTGADGVSTGNTPVLTSQPALISGYCMDTAGGATPAASAGAGWVNEGSAFSTFNGTALLRSESKRVTATTALPATFTAGVNETHQSFAAVFLEAASGIVPPPQIARQLYVMP